MSDLRPHLTVLLGVLFISFSAIFVRMAEAPSSMIAFYRMLFTVILLLPLFWKGRQEWKTITLRNFVLCFFSGVSLALHFYAFMASLDYTSVTSSTVLVTIHPVFVGLASVYLLKEKISPGFVQAVVLTLLGGFIISISDSGQASSALFGDFLAFLGAIFMTIYMLIGRVARQKLGLISYTFIVYASSTVTLLLINITLSKPFYPYPAKDWLLFFAMAFVCTFLGHNILNWALKYLNPAFISTAILGEPVFATFWALLFFQEVPEIPQLAGSAIVILGIFQLIRRMRPSNP